MTDDLDSTSLPLLLHNRLNEKKLWVHFGSTIGSALWLLKAFQGGQVHAHSFQYP